MTLDPTIAWGLLAAVALLAVAFVHSRMRAALRRRARRLRYRTAADDGLLVPQVTARPAISREQVDAISRDAQQAALRVAHNEQPQTGNPHPARTREFVLWEATFHSALSDFAELAEQAQVAAANTREPH